jgi:hypothetical protein
MPWLRASLPARAVALLGLAVLGFGAIGTSTSTAHGVVGAEPNTAHLYDLPSASTTPFANTRVRVFRGYDRLNGSAAARPAVAYYADSDLTGG